MSSTIESLSPANIWLGRSGVRTEKVTSDLYVENNVSIDLNKMFREHQVTIDRLAMPNSTCAVSVVTAITRIVPYLRRAYTPNQTMLYVHIKEFIDHVFNRSIHRNRSMFGTTRSDVSANKVGMFIQTPNTPLSSNS